MPAVTRAGDACTGHGPWPPRASTGGSGDVFVNAMPAHRLGDAWAVHCDPTPICHGGALASGSATVFVNGRALGRVGDPVSCGSSVAGGSGDVFAGG
ncbi:putative Zn-binding protein involved in type VI secretion [Rubricella aquisinus]|uniref:Putative Zn-binding protein involved in type VI secretion n=1 Tax=Rubricella aquisinus TaxID=2028108 RepID=A0A840WKZ6_9RHOB|nr:PAAR domain-containing protein [Rubricella aquisinus]MBB5515768.1 putative Zn-binding protein involved in type VI secretion [Rubricella aquisinus]